MPEGPEMRRAADRIERAIGGHEAVAVEFAFPHLASFEKKLSGRVVERIETRGKALLVHFAGGLSIYTHNQLYGRWYVMAAGKRPKTNRSLRLAIHADARSALLYSASEIDVWRTAKLHEHPFLSKLGPDALDPTLTDAALAARLAGPRFARRQLHALLLDQGFVAGIGNYLRSEILFVAGIHPTCRLRDLEEDQRRALARAILSVTRQAYRTGGITNDVGRVKELKAQGMRRSEFRHRVFTRGDQPCFDCHTTVQHEVLAGRKIFHCPQCQSPPPEQQAGAQRRASS